MKKKIFLSVLLCLIIAVGIIIAPKIKERKEMDKKIQQSVKEYLEEKYNKEFVVGKVKMTKAFGGTYTVKYFVPNWVSVIEVSAYPIDDESMTFTVIVAGREEYERKEYLDKNNYKDNYDYKVKSAYLDKKLEEGYLYTNTKDVLVSVSISYDYAYTDKNFKNNKNHNELGLYIRIESKEKREIDYIRIEKILDNIITIFKNEDYDVIGIETFIFNKNSNEMVKYEYKINNIKNMEALQNYRIPQD